MGDPTHSARSRLSVLRFSSTVRVLVLLVLASLAEAAQDSSSAEYWFYVASESEDEVSLLRFSPAERADPLRAEKTIPVGIRPTEIEGPHGLRVSPDGLFWYASLAHGNPFGAVYKFRTGDDALVASVDAGLFPATLDIAASTGLLYVVNFDLHGDMKPSTVSVIETETMAEVAQVEVGIMPHSSRLNAAGSRLYSVMMMSDELVELDAYRFEVLRRLRLSEPQMRGPVGPAGPDRAAPMATVKPTWVDPGPNGRFVYVACNGSDEIKEVDLDTWVVTRTFQTGAGPYNLEVSSDGEMLVVTHKTEGTTGVWDLSEGREVARISNTRQVPHGVVISPDSRYAFVSVEGIGGDPGTVDVIDLETFELTASINVGMQASGIAFWKMTESD